MQRIAGGILRTCLAVLVGAAAGAASAQDVPTSLADTVFLVSEGDDLLATIADALDAQSPEVRTTVQIAEGDYPVAGTITIPADSNFRLLGTGRAWQVVLEGDGTGPVIEIQAQGDTDAADTVNRVLIQNLAVTGGTVGVRISGTVIDPGPEAAYSPILDRCYIHSNATHGVEVLDDAQPVIINCSIVQNAGDGVRVGDVTDPAAAGAFATLLFNSIILNGDNGVYVTGENSASVRNTLVYRNGDGVPDRYEAGVRWDMDPFISPQFGVYDETTRVTITGTGLFADVADANTTRVFFGPPPYVDTDDADADADYPANTEWAFDSANDTGGLQQLAGDAPPAWNGQPGPVDVYIYRNDGGDDTLDGDFLRIIRDGFVYIQSNETAAPGLDDLPYVDRAVPGKGPVEGGNWVYVYGARFDKGADAGFDFDANGDLDNGERATRIEWLSSGLMRIQAPPLPDPGLLDDPLDVLVRNTNDLGLPDDQLTSPVGAYREYYYTDELSADDQPIITQILPNTYPDPVGTGTQSEEDYLATVVGDNFLEGAAVTIGGVLCPYPVDGLEDATGDGVFDRINDVWIPVAAFGAGGAYDVVVTNPGGLFDVLPNGFTYFGDGVPRIEASPFPWRLTNFAEYGLGGPRRLRGAGFDTGITITFRPAAFDAGDPANSDATIADVGPNELAAPHTGHTQREIQFNMPGAPSDLDPLLDAGDRSIDVQIWNAYAALPDPDGDPSYPEDAAVVSRASEITRFHWADDGLPLPASAGQAVFWNATRPRPSADPAHTYEIEITPSEIAPDIELSVLAGGRVLPLEDVDADAATGVVAFDLTGLDVAVYGPLDLAVVLACYLQRGAARGS